MSSWLWRVLPSLVVVGGFADAAFAEGMERAERAAVDADGLRQRFDDAVALFIGGEYDAALDAFESIRDVRPGAVVDYNIAWCLARLRRDAEAVEAFDEYLSRYPEDDAERRSRARAEATRLRGLIIGWPQENAPEPPSAPLAGSDQLEVWLDDVPSRPRVESESLPVWLDQPSSSSRGDLPPPSASPSGNARRSRSGLGSTPFGWFELEVENNVAYRSFEVPINPSCDTAGRTEALFESSVYPEIGLRLSVYPGGLFTSRWPSGFGVEIVFRHHLYLEVVNRREGQEVDASASFVSIGTTYRYAYGTVDHGFSLWGRFGYGRPSFYLGDVGNDIVPPATYDSLYLGLSMYVPFSTRYFGAELGANYLAVISVDSRMTLAYNASGELPDANGYQVFAGLSGQIYRGLCWRVGFEVLGVVSEHHGKGRGYGSDPSTLCDSTDCLRFSGCVDNTDPDRPPVTGGIFTTDRARDLSWRVILGISYRFAGDPDR